LAGVIGAVGQLAVATTVAAATATANWLGAADGSWTDHTRSSTSPNHPNNGSPLGNVAAVPEPAVGAFGWMVGAWALGRGGQNDELEIDDSNS
jgi:hypothetical protein